MNKDDPAIPLAIDLDGTLLGADSTILLARRALFTARFLPLFNIFRGRLAFKTALSKSIPLSLEGLPWNRFITDLILSAKKIHRPIWLVTASSMEFAKNVCSYFEFDGVAASGTTINLKGQSKAEWLVNQFGEKGYDYAGNSMDDLAAWSHCRIAFVSAKFKKIDLAHQACDNVIVFPAP